MTGGRSWLVSWYIMATALFLSILLMGQRAAALLEMQEDLASSTEKEISNIAFIPKVRTPILPYAPVDKISYRENTRLVNPFITILKRDLNNFFSHINPESEQTDWASENSHSTINLEQKTKFSKTQYLIQRICSKYMNGLVDATSTNAGTVEIIKYLCKSLGAESKHEEYTIVQSSDEVNSTNVGCKDGKCRVIDWPKELRSLLYKVLNSRRSRPVRTGSKRPRTHRPRSKWMSYSPINGRREWRVLNEEYPGMMKQYIHKYGNTTFVI